VAAQEPVFQRIFDDLIADWDERDEVEFMALAYKLPLYVVTTMLGVPREDAEQVKLWGDLFLSSQENPLRPETVRAKKQGLDEYREYTTRLIERHRADAGRSELIAAVLDAAAGDRLTAEELIAFFLHTLIVGHETTEHMIGNGLRALLTHRDQWEAICRDPSLVPGAVEEILRWDPPVPFISKVAAAGAQVAGVPIREGSGILLVAAAANRDPAVFDAPERFDVTRKANDHVTLGWGAHFCLGASLARLEGRIVFGTLARRFPGLDFAVDPATLRFRGGIRGLESLPLKP